MEADKGPEHALLGKTCADFYINQVIGKGNFGAVYRAYDTVLKVERAVKILAPQYVWHEEVVRDFENEAVSAARLGGHPSIVHIYRYGRCDGNYYIAMELCDGEDLSRWLRNGPMTPERVVPILDQVASALDYAHSAGNIHLDIKPANIMLSADGKAKLLDFGLMRARNRTMHLTNAGRIKGTVPYMSPEQARGVPDNQLTPATDIYSLGMTVYRMLAGHTAFEDPGTTSVSEYAILNKHLSEPPPPVPGVSAAVDAVVQRALAKEPSQRWPTVGEFARQFALAVASAPAAVVPPPPPPPPPARTEPFRSPEPGPVSTPIPPKPPDSPAKWIVAGLLGALVVITGAFLLMRALDDDLQIGGGDDATATRTATAKATATAVDTPTSSPATAVPPTPVPPTPVPPTPARPTPVRPTPVPPTPVPPTPQLETTFHVWCDPTCDLNDDTTCGAFHWRIVGVKEAYVVTGAGSQAVGGPEGSIANICLPPGEKQEFKMRVVWPDGRSEEKGVTFRRDN